MTTTAPMKLRLSTPAQTRLKLAVSTIKMRSLVTYPASISGGLAIDVTSVNGALTVALDLLKLGIVIGFDPTAEYVTLVDANGNYVRVSVSALIQNAVSIQVVTGVGDINVGLSTTLLVMNRAVDQNPSNIILPAANQKVGKVKIVDFKGNSDAFPHTIKTTAPDTFQGALTQWSLNGAGASVALDPIPGTGYAV